MYIYQMPPSVLHKLSSILDRENSYKDLALNHMMFDKSIMQIIESAVVSGTSPSKAIIMKWSKFNHTVDELFCLLFRMKEYESIHVIKDYIDDEKYLSMLDKIPTEKITHKSQSDIVSCEDNEAINQSEVHLDILKDNMNIASSAASTIPEIPYDDLKDATNNWNSDCVLGSGGFATVYKGTWKCTQVAVKRININDENVVALKQIITEVRVLNSCRHDNILPLYGYSVNGPAPCLIYQFMPKGSLQSRLRCKNNEPILSWRSRLDIVTGTARGLQFLHTVRSKPLIHGDIKPANILLDKNECPRIGDFGLAQEGPASGFSVIRKVFGTLPYLPLEILKDKKFSTKVDVYSFGIVLLEVCTGLSAFSNKFPQKFLCNYVLNYDGNIIDLKDKRVQDDEDSELFLLLIYLGKWCSKVKPNERPEMINVLTYLDDISDKIN